MLEKLRLRTQILIFLISMIILVTLIVVIQQLYVLQGSLEILSQTSRHILSMQIDRSLNTQSYFINRVVSRQFRIQQRRVDSVTLIYRFLDHKGDSAQIRKPDPCVSAQQINSLEFNLTRVCFGNFNTSEQQKIPEGEQYFLQAKLCSVLNQYSTAIDSTIKKTKARLYLYSNLEKGFACVYPTAYIIPQFNLQSTSWYQQHIQSGQINSYSNLSFLITAPFSLRTVITQSLLDNNQLFHGVVGVDLIFSEQKLQNIKNSLFIINKQGQIILANVDFYINITQASYIYNQSQSGFNEQDWQEMQKVINGQIYHKQCSNGKYLCLFNQIINQEVQVIATKMQSEFISIMQLFFHLKYRFSSDFTYLIKMLDSFEQQFIFINYQTVVSQIGAGFIILLFTLFCVFLVTRPINNIINIVKRFIMKYGNNIQKDMFIEGLFKSLFKQSSEFDIVISIIKKQEKMKNIQCLILEKFQLPKVKGRFKRDHLIKIKLIFNTLKDANHLLFVQEAIDYFYHLTEKNTQLL